MSVLMTAWSCLFAVAAGAPLTPKSLECETAAKCTFRSSALVGAGWSPLHWRYRTEFANRARALATEVDLDNGYPASCEGGTPAPNICLLVWMHTGHAGWAHLACEAGDVGSCLLDALELPPAEAHARLADLCRRGAANACAWHAEVSLRTDAVLAGPFAMAQRACLELQEPVACAAAGKVAGARDMPEQSAFWHQTACDWGYVPSCDVEDRNTRTLAEEAPPAVVGPSMLKPESLEPLPGRPALPR